MKICAISCVITLIMATLCTAQERGEIAITLDDLPFVGTNSNDPGNVIRTHDRFMNIIQALQKYQAPATGFVIAGAIGKGQWELLNAFRDAGYGLGNHTYSHENLARISAEKYILNLDKADKRLAQIMTSPKYSRYPYLAEGYGVKKQEVLDYLVAHQYVIAPVSIDSKDYQFNARFLRYSWRIRTQHLQEIKRDYLAYIWKQTLRAEKIANGKPVKQIILMHSNLLNSLCLEDVLKMYQEHGYRFISLTEALELPASQVADNKTMFWKQTAIVGDDWQSMPKELSDS